MTKPLTELQEQRFAEFRKLVEHGIAKGWLTVRPDAQAIGHPKLYQPNQRRDRPPRLIGLGATLSP